MEEKKLKRRPYYNENPNLKYIKIKTHNGKIEYKIHCVLIGKKYYVKDIDCFKRNDSWSIADKMFYDYELKKEVSSTHGLIEGIVNVNIIDNSFTMGFFTPNISKNVDCIYVYGGALKQSICISADIFLKNTNFVESLHDNMFFSKESLKINSFSNHFRRTTRYTNLSENYVYEQSDILENVTNSFNKNNMVIEPNIKKLGSVFEDLTFGCEIELSSGKLPERFLYSNGLVLCKDGSINYTPEYVTIPLNGAKGIQSIKNTFLELNKRAITNKDCSLHYHFGNINTSREYIVKLFKTFYMLQNDILKMLPDYKVNWENVKKNDYCAKLPNLVSKYEGGDYKDYIRTQYIKIEKFIYGGRNPGEDFNRHGNINPWGQHKWNIKTR